MRSILQISILAFTGIAIAEPTKTKKDDAIATLRGEWQQQSHSVLAGAKEKVNEGDLAIEIRETSTEFSKGVLNRDDFLPLLVSADFVLDPTTTPLQIDVTLKWKDGAQKRLGIYKLVGDSFTICWGETRPTKFECGAEAGNGSFVATFKRVKR